MSENEDLQREGFNEINGKSFYRDKYANWFQKASGYESAFLKDIIDQGLMAEIMNEIQNSAEAKISLQYDGRWYTIWQNMEDGYQSSVNRKSDHSGNNANTTYDRTVETKGEAQQTINKFSNPPNQNNKFSGNFGGGGDGKSKYFVDQIKLKIMTAEEFQSGLTFEPMWNIAEKATENIKLIKDENGDMHYHIILQHKKAF